MITKSYLKSKKCWKVTFSVPEKELPDWVTIKRVNLVGSFNKWDNDATPMKFIKRRKAWKASIYLAPASTVQFRYLINGQHWSNDWHADGYAPNAMGSENCIVNLPPAE